MKHVQAIIRPMKLEQVKAALAALDFVTGITVTDVRGGDPADQPHVPGMRGAQYVTPLPHRIKLDLIVPDEDAVATVQTICRHARTGEPGDGKVFVLDVADSVRIRTGEHGILLDD
jgi:nitrogen regulatory protein P-II 1